MIETVQWLRGYAALMVIIHHARNSDSWLFNPLDGYNGFAWGVDIFFAISGFIMYSAARNETPLDFIKRRIIRVVPLYWLATISLLIITCFKLRTFSISHDNLIHLVQSMLFIPHYSPSEPDHGLFPFLIPGWTLNYEMLFYFIFFVALTIKRPLFITTTVVIIIICLGRYFKESGNAIIEAYSNLQLIEFIVGLWIGYLFSENKINKSMSILLPIGVVLLFWSSLFTTNMTLMICRIIFSSLILIGTVGLSYVAPKLDKLSALGNASYSIYLTHTVLGIPISRKLIEKIPIGGWCQFTVWILTSLTISIIIGLLVYFYIEKPILRRLQTRHKTS